MNYTIQMDSGEYFSFAHRLNVVDNERQFLMHYHPYPEIYLFIKGTATFCIEGAIYDLEPYDLILVPAYMIHQPYPEISTVFERYILNVYPDFYDKLGCPEYSKLFSNLTNFMYKIPGHIIKRTNFINILKDIRTYSDDYQDLNQPVIRYKIGELLYILNSIENFENFNTQNPVVQEIIDYIENNFMTIEGLDELALRFNYTKSHLGYIFKNGTGMTIAHYITIKRIEYVKSRYVGNTDISLSAACLEAGFGNYGNFAYNYKKIFGTSPKADLKTLFKP